MSTRLATHAGSWYPKSRSSLVSQLDSFIEDTDPANHARADCRIIISPHAGYTYSGPTAAYGFKALDWSGVKRVFILGPSHHFYLRGCALSKCQTYATPLGELRIDTSLIQELSNLSEFDDMSLDVDQDEHSIEMQLPYLKHVMPAGSDVSLVPILVGNLNFEAEIRYGKILSPYLQDSSNLFVISSDFCHWGDRFSYTYYEPVDAAPINRVTSRTISNGRPIWRSIEAVDKEGMQLISSGSHRDFAEYLKRTKNTICGRHPIGVILAAMEHVALPGKFVFLDYKQSNQVISVTDGSVSYASGVHQP